MINRNWSKMAGRTPIFEARIVFYDQIGCLEQCSLRLLFDSTFHTCSPSCALLAAIHLHGDGWEGQPSGPLMGPGGLATPEASECLRAPPQHYSTVRRQFFGSEGSMAAQVPLPPLFSFSVGCLCSCPLRPCHATYFFQIVLSLLDLEAVARRPRAYRSRRRVRGERRSGFRTHRWHSPATGIPTHRCYVFERDARSH